MKKTPRNPDRPYRLPVLPVLCFAAAATPALAQPFDLSWHTADGGGGTSSGGSFTVSGTIGQHDAGTMSGGSFTVLGGFWTAPPPCYPDCDPGSGPGILDIFDFLCFQNRFAALDPYACDCDTLSGPAVCDIFDFLCFQNHFAAGCP